MKNIGSFRKQLIKTISWKLAGLECGVLQPNENVQTRYQGKETKDTCKLDFK